MGWNFLGLEVVVISFTGELWTRIHVEKDATLTLVSMLIRIISCPCRLMMMRGTGGASFIHWREQVLLLFFGMLQLGQLCFEVVVVIHERYSLGSLRAG